MSMARRRGYLAGAVAALLVLGVFLASTSTTLAQNKKRAWEIFIYFGEYGSQTVPSAIQKGTITTYRLDPFAAAIPDPSGIPTDPNTPRFCVICKNLGLTGPTDQYLGPIAGGSYTPVDPCPGDPNQSPWALDPNLPYLDECDDDIEAKYVYNKTGIVTNGEVQRNDAEFLLGARVGYNITRHWEVELDLGFAKQRLDMTKNLIPLLSEPVTNPADPWYERLAKFYEFTWANVDFLTLGYNPIFGADPNNPEISGAQEIPNVPHHRASKNPGADIPAILPMPSEPGETFEDVTDFVNRVFLDPQAFRNRANQINIDIFSVGLAGLFNFNTKPDSRIVPYLQAGYGRWMRSFDSPYEGEDTDYLTYGGGVRFFVNEIFSFRAEWRGVLFQEDTATITAKLPKQNLLDLSVVGSGACVRDQDPPAQQPPIECNQSYLQAYNNNERPRLPRNSGAGGRASVEFVTETDSFWEARIGFDVLLGGK